MNNLNIPKIIHLTYKDNNIPQVWSTTIDKWKSIHPDWKVMFWSDDDNRKLIETKYPDFLEIYDSYEYGIQRADAVRYYILYTYGGLYSDLDIQPKKRFDKLFQKICNKNVYLIRSAQVNSSLTNCLMASKKKSRFWLHVFKELKDRFTNPSLLWIGKHWVVMNTTGPIMIDNAYRTFTYKKDVSFLPSELILPNKCSICTIKPCSTKSGYTKLLDGCSWIQTDTKIYNFFLCKYKMLFSILISIILIVLRFFILFK